TARGQPHARSARSSGAARGARAGGRAHGAHRHAHGHDGGQSGISTTSRGICAGLQQSGWTIGQNVRVDYRWGDGNADSMRKHAAELVALSPDVILAHSSAAVAPLLQVTRTIPIVFTGVTDPVGAGYVDSLARPGGNATGFVTYEYSMAGKFLELLKEIAPHVTRVAVLRESAIASGPAQFGVIQAVAPLLGVELRP